MQGNCRRTGSFVFRDMYGKFKLIQAGNVVYNMYARICLVLINIR